MPPAAAAARRQWRRPPVLLPWQPQRCKHLCRLNRACLLQRTARRLLRQAAPQRQAALQSAARLLAAARVATWAWAGPTGWPPGTCHCRWLASAAAGVQARAERVPSWIARAAEGWLSTAQAGSAAALQLCWQQPLEQLAPPLLPQTAAAGGPAGARYAASLPKPPPPQALQPTAAPWRPEIAVRCAGLGAWCDGSVTSWIGCSGKAWPTNSAPGEAWTGRGAAWCQLQPQSCSCHPLERLQRHW